jgi:hypothetical protein
MKTTERYHQFTQVSYSGRRLLEKHSLSETGTWRIRGEDPNCDLAGHHHMPDLGVVEGKLDDIIRYAVSLPGFWQWGAGGEISKIEIKTVDSDTIRKTAELQARKAALEAELAEINKVLPK